MPTRETSALPGDEISLKTKNKEKCKEVLCHRVGLEGCVLWERNVP